MYKRICDECMSARKEKNLIKKNLLITLKSEIEMIAKDAKREVLEEDCLAKVKAFIKGINFSLDEYGKDHTTKIIDVKTSPLIKLKTELAILRDFLPTAMDDDQLEKHINWFIEGTEEPKNYEVNETDYVVSFNFISRSV